MIQYYEWHTCPLWVQDYIRNHLEDQNASQKNGGPFVSVRSTDFVLPFSLYARLQKVHGRKMTKVVHRHRPEAEKFDKPKIIDVWYDVVGNDL
jgi:hypothetical protein